MSPTPKELDPQYFRKPIELLCQVIKEGKYSWVPDQLKAKASDGLLIDFSSSGELCVHPIMKWSRESIPHKEVRCGDDFRDSVGLTEPKSEQINSVVTSSYFVNWEEVGIKGYRQEMGSGSLFVLVDNHVKLDDFSFKELEKGLLRAAGRLCE